MKKKKNILSINIAKNSFTADEKTGLIKFKKPLTITDTSEQWNGTRYDIKSMDISGYKGLLTADHSSNIEKAIGNVGGLRKIANKRVVIDSIDLAIEENALSLFAFNMISAGYLTDFSIETMGTWPDEDGIYHDSNLVGLSLVTSGNNKSASINELKQVVVNSIKEAKELNLDTSFVEDNYMCYDNNSNCDRNKEEIKKENKIMFKTIKNSRGFAIEVKYTNAAGDECSLTLNDGQTVDVAEDQAEAVQKQVDEAVKPEEKKVDAPVDKTVEAVASLAKTVEALEKKIFDNSAKEPTFKKDTAKKDNALAEMDWSEMHGLQINAAWDLLKGKSSEAGVELQKMNEHNLERLKEEGVVKNVVTIADMGNFVISPELLTEIEGHRSNFSALLSKVQYKETLSLQMAWLSRSGDIDMEEVETCDDDADGNLKPISELGATINQSNLMELAAVTPVCNAATRFLAVDLLGDVAAGYRNDYDRKKSQLFIARLQQAVDATGNKIPYDGTTDVTTLQSWIDCATSQDEEIMNGFYIFNNKTYGELKKRIVGGGISGPLGNLFTTGDQPLIDGRPYVIVPNELMPSLNSAETKSFTVEGATVTIDQAVFYVDFATFSGRISGGLKYDLSTEAAYEVSGTVKSAFQRNELVLRGSFFRGGAVRDTDKVASMFAAGVS